MAQVNAKMNHAMPESRAPAVGRALSPSLQGQPSRTRYLGVQHVVELVRRKGLPPRSRSASRPTTGAGTSLTKAPAWPATARWA
jgi:hypothetical protein